MSSLRELLSHLAEFQETTETHAHDLRLDLASLIGRGLDGKTWTQGQLAQATDMTPSQISRMINAGRNCTLESVARVSFALGMRFRLVESPEFEFNVSGDQHGETTLQGHAGSAIFFGQTDTATNPGIVRISRESNERFSAVDMG